MTSVLDRYPDTHKPIVSSLTTEALIDGLEWCVVRFKDVYHGKIRRKYLEQAIDLVGRDWSNCANHGIKHKFIFDLADILKIDSSIAGELIELSNNTPSTLDYVVRQVVKRLFAQGIAAWVYESACNDIEVVLKS